MNDILSLALSTMLKTAIVGEWSYIGECNSERRVFTSTGNFFILEKKKGEWKNKATYVYSINDVVIQIGEPNSDVLFKMKAESMTLSSLKFCNLNEDFSWDCDMKFYYEKCEAR